MHARVLKPWRGHLPSVFSSYHSPGGSGFNWCSLTLLGGPGPFTSKMASLSTGSAHTPSLGFRTLVLQVSKNSGNKGLGGWVGMNFIGCVNTVIYDLWITRLCVQVKNEPCARRIGYMRLISWIHPRGRGTVTTTSETSNKFVMVLPTPSDT